MKGQTGRLGDIGFNSGSWRRPTTKIVRIDKSLPMPEFQSQGALAFDLHARINGIEGAVTPANGGNQFIYIEPGEMFLVPCNIVIKYPSGYGAFVFPRSSLFKKKGLILSNGVGVIDKDYSSSGDENTPPDEIKMLLYNVSDKAARIEHGERIGQVALLRVEIPNIIEVDELAGPARGGYGSTQGYTDV